MDNSNVRSATMGEGEGMVGALGPSADTLAERLRRAGCVATEEEAAELLADFPDFATLENRVIRREQGEPLAWIVGRISFCDLEVRVAPGVYVPRLQTQELARRAASFLGSGRSADLCTGSGAIACVLKEENPNASVLGVDIDANAVACARSNGVPALMGHLGDALASSSFDVVTAVAPYVPTSSLELLPRDVVRYEPRASLDGGEDGLDVVRSVVTSAARILRPGGWLLVEVGGDQDVLLASALDAEGFVGLDSWSDDEGDLRGIAARRG
jgi:release factor glutamine methyltransferase